MNYYYPVSAQDSFLVVIDIQERLCPAMDQAVSSGVIRNTGRLMEAASLTGVPSVVTEQYPKGLGPTVADLAVREGFSRFEKIHFNAAADEKIEAHIGSLGRRTAVLTGMEAHICVFFTACDLLEKGYRVVIASDAVCSRNGINKEEALSQLRNAGAMILPSETIMFSLIERAGTDAFKKISAMVK
ncbi:MAG: isochorismatase family protein [Spirochaetota bacterium]